MITMPFTAARRSPVLSLQHVTLVTLLALIALISTSTSARADVGLGVAESFAVLAGTSVTNTGATTIVGDIGVSPGSSVTGDETIVQTGGAIYTEAEAAPAQADLLIAYDDAIGRAFTSEILVDLTDADLAPGVYQSTSAGAFLLPSGATMTLNGGPDDVWIFQATALEFASGSEILLAGGADPCHVFWVVESTAILGAGASIVGTIMALTSITLADGATLVGRALARNAEVTMIGNTITNLPCVTPVEDEPEPVVEEPAPVVEEPAAQVPEVPIGPVATGDGSGAATTRGALTILTALLVLLVIGSSVRYAGRRPAGR